MTFFPSRYPIMCAVMNGVSDLALALAVEKAGGMPSLLVHLRQGNGPLSLTKLDTVFCEFQNQTGHTNIVIGINHKDLLEPKFIEWTRSRRPSHIEILGSDTDNSRYCYDPQWNICLSGLRKVSKIISRFMTIEEDHDWLDAISVKGRESAGFVTETSVKELTQKLLAHPRRQVVIPYGGVGTAEQVRDYINMGAAAVACGTIFAASLESCLSPGTKQAIVRAGIQDLVTFPDTGQRALVLGSIESTLQDQSNWNRWHSLQQGIHGDGHSGHIYMGESVQYVTSIRPVSQIIQDLARLL